VDFLKNWAEVNGWLSLRIFCVILALLFLQNVLKEFKIIDLLSRTLAPVMGVMGLSRNVSFLWLVAQTLGLTYGAGILIEEINKGEITRSEANKLNYHLAISHSQFEDPMLFVAIGAPYFWVSLPRYVFSLLVVWIIVGIEHWRMKRLQRL
jgi:spore maturation protein SpmB